jgi:hypothetical protein
MAKRRNERTIAGEYSKPNTEMRRDPRIDDSGNFKEKGRSIADVVDKNSDLSSVIKRK